MSHEEILAERDGYRAVLVQDGAPHKPDNDGAIPAFLIWSGMGGFSLGGYVNDNYMPLTPEQLFTVWSRFRDVDRDNHNILFGRWLVAFYGVKYVNVKGVSGYSQSDWGFEVSIVTQEWLDMTGCTVEDCKREVEEDKEPTELLSWALGDCWGIRVQKLTRFAELDDNGDVIEDSITEQWAYKGESRWGYYGPSWTAYFVDEGNMLIDDVKD